jgi:transposase InsO family protein/transposase-like protein
MHSYEERIRAVERLIENGYRSNHTRRELGYPKSKNTLRAWLREYQEFGDLKRQSGRRAVYDRDQIQAAVEHYLCHGKSLSATVNALGYPHRETLREWIDVLAPGCRVLHVGIKNPKRYTDDQRSEAVIALCTRTESADTVAQRAEVSRQTLYQWRARLLGESEDAMDREELHESGPDKTSDDIANLREEVLRLRLERDILTHSIELAKKDPGADLQTLSNKEKAIVISALKECWPLHMLLRELDLAKSSYYYQVKALQAQDKYLEIRKRIVYLFWKAERRYGYRRIHDALVAEGVRISEKVVRRIMSEEGLNAKMRRKRPWTSYRGEVTPAVPNILERDFTAALPNEKWLTDLTQFQLPAGTVYLSPIVECFDGMIVSWTIGTSPDAHLVNTMLENAISTLSESERPIIHSDRGVHYRWPGWIELMNRHELPRSMSRKACAPDNAACEGFFGRLKNEMFYDEDWRDVTLHDFTNLLDEYIHWYNNERIKVSLGGMSPLAYRRSLGIAA